MRVGVDVVDAARVGEAVETFGDRYLHRVFTADELADCAGAPEARDVSLAGRFAAKEAVFKALGVVLPAPPWAVVAIRRGSAGRPEVQLRPDAAAVVAAAGVRDIDVSISHEGHLATAVATAVIAAAEPAQGANDVTR